MTARLLTDEQRAARVCAWTSSSATGRAETGLSEIKPSSSSIEDGTCLSVARMTVVVQLLPVMRGKKEEGREEEVKEDEEEEKEDSGERGRV
jgi:hypothetical protein